MRYHQQYEPFDSEDDEGDMWSEICPSASSTTSAIKDDDDDDTVTSVASAFDFENRKENTIIVLSPIKSPLTRVQLDKNPETTIAASSISPPFAMYWKRNSNTVSRSTHHDILQRERDAWKCKYRNAVMKHEKEKQQLVVEQHQQQIAININNNNIKELEERLRMTELQRDDAVDKLEQKERHLSRTLQEVAILKKILQQSNDTVQMQRDHALTVAMEKKDMILQNYHEKIIRLQQQLDASKKREEEMQTSFQQEIQILQQSSASAETPSSRGSDENVHGNENNNVPPLEDENNNNNNNENSMVLVAKHSSTKEKGGEKGQTMVVPFFNFSNQHTFRQVNAKVINSNHASMYK